MRYEKEKFRSTSEWQKKAEEIKQRDTSVCQACIRNLQGTECRINSKRLSVHHAEPLSEAYELRLDNNNLITLCEKHHELAERGIITLEKIKEIIRQQEDKREQ